MSRPVSLSPSLKPIRVSSAFGVRREYPKGSGKWTPPHDGVDWATPVGLPLVSGITGTVALRGGGPSHIWGNFIHLICDCPQRHTQEFHILRELPSWLAEGDRVEPGDIIGYTGRSGSLNGKPYDPHHHQGATVNGTHYNPLIIGWPDVAGGGTPFDNTEPIVAEKKDMTMRYFYAPSRGGMVDTENSGPYIPTSSEEAIALSAMYNGIDVSDRQWDVLRQASLNRQSAANTATGKAVPLAGIIAVVDQIKAIVDRRVDRGLDADGNRILVEQIQDNANGTTNTVALLGQVAALTELVKVIAAEGSGVAPTDLNDLFAKLDEIPGKTIAALGAAITPER